MEQQLIRWVMASERLPKEDGIYVCKLDKRGEGVRSSTVSYMEHRICCDKFLNINNDGYEVVEWLEEL